MERLDMIIDTSTRKVLEALLDCIDEATETVEDGKTVWKD